MVSYAYRFVIGSPSCEHGFPIDKFVTLNLCVRGRVGKAYRVLDMVLMFIRVCIRGCSLLCVYISLVEI